MLHNRMQMIFRMHSTVIIDYEIGLIWFWSNIGCLCCTNGFNTYLHAYVRIDDVARVVRFFCCCFSSFVCLFICLSSVYATGTCMSISIYRYMWNNFCTRDNIDDAVTLVHSRTDENFTIAQFRSEFHLLSSSSPLSACWRRRLCRRRGRRRYRRGRRPRHCCWTCWGCCFLILMPVHRCWAHILWSMLI